MALVRDEELRPRHCVVIGFVLADARRVGCLAAVSRIAFVGLQAGIY